MRQLVSTPLPRSTSRRHSRRRRQAHEAGPRQQDASRPGQALRDFWAAAYSSVEIRTVSAAGDDASGDERLEMDGVVTLAWT